MNKAGDEEESQEGQAELETRQEQKQKQQRPQDIVTTIKDATLPDPSQATASDHSGYPGATSATKKHKQGINYHYPHTRFDAPSKTCISRIHSDLKELQREPLHGIIVTRDEARNNVCHALIMGPSDTPYENGFFQFVLEFPNNYPYEPPRVTFLTTSGGKVRFNPNLYPCGTVCLSILGTWIGPGWSSVQTIGSLLMSIQSLLNSYPYLNEPGFEGTPTSSNDVRTYNQYLRHETLKVAVIGSINTLLDPQQYLRHKTLKVAVIGSISTLLPYKLQQELRHGNPSTSISEYARALFLDLAESYKYTCEEYAFLDGRIHFDKFSGQSCRFEFRLLKQKIEQLEEQLLGRGAGCELKIQSSPVPTNSTPSL